MWGGPSAPLPPVFSRESSLAGAGCESRPLKVGGSLGVLEEAVQRRPEEWPHATHVLGRAPVLESGPSVPTA